MHDSDDTTTSHLFELIRTVEFDLMLGDERFTTRAELFRSTEDDTVFRCRLWQTGLYTIQSRFPADPETNEPAQGPSDEGLLVESNHLRSDWDPDRFLASSPEEAIRMIRDGVAEFVEHVTSVSDA